eukprot:498376-Hanusia_phi.AAC.3
MEHEQEGGAAIERVEQEENIPGAPRTPYPYPFIFSQGGGGRSKGSKRSLPSSNTQVVTPHDRLRKDVFSNKDLSMPFLSVHPLLSNNHPV